MRRQAGIKRRDNNGRQQAWRECGGQSTDMARYANGWQKGEIFLPRYIALNNSM